ncbi:MAG TPA: hypothetical protein DCE41_35425, partial [Cytophagales bacterium]|nr:hypothetical protein [Cytophagales bacterium]
SHVWEGLVILWLPAFLYVLVRFGRRLWGVRWVRTCLLIVAMGVCLVSVALMAYWKGERAQHLPPTAQILFVSEEESSLRALLSRPELAGKVVYVDLWHTGCKPCLEEFALMPGLRGQYAEGELAILYVARETGHLDSKNRWLRQLHSRNLEGYHVYLSKDQAEALAAQIPGFVGYPHHLLVDSAGQVQDWDAPGPSEAEVLERELEFLIAGSRASLSAEN